MKRYIRDWVGSAQMTSHAHWSGSRVLRGALLVLFCLLAAVLLAPTSIARPRVPSGEGSLGESAPLDEAPPADVRLVPVVPFACLGRTVDIDVFVEDATGLYGHKFRMHFDPSVFEVVTDDADPITPGWQLPPGSIWGRIAHALEQGMAYYGGSIEHMYVPAWQVPLGDTHYMEALTSVITELAEDPAIVIRGRGSQFILKDHPTAFHVLTVAPLEVRITRVMEAMKLDQEEAKKEIDRFDDSRRTFIKRYFNADLEDPVHYHLTINTWHLSYGAAAQIIVDGASLRH